jgi:hypothetical protein
MLSLNTKVENEVLRSWWQGLRPLRKKNALECVADSTEWQSDWKSEDRRSYASATNHRVINTSFGLVIPYYLLAVEYRAQLSLSPPQKRDGKKVPAKCDG